MHRLRNTAALLLSIHLSLLLINAQKPSETPVTPRIELGPGMGCVIKNPKLPKAKPTPTPGPGEIDWDPPEITPDFVTYFARSLDYDCDSISNAEDKCSTFPSKNNRDSDGDGWGDVCDKISSDIEIKLIASRTRIRVGTKIRFSIVVKNHGPKEAAQIVRVTANFPSALRIDSMEAPDRMPDEECDEMDGGLICDLNPIPVGQSTTIKLLATARKARKATAIAEAENGVGDLKRRNNRARTAIHIVR